MATYHTNNHNTCTHVAMWLYVAIGMHQLASNITIACYTCSYRVSASHSYVYT